MSRLRFKRQAPEELSSSSPLFALSFASSPQCPSSWSPLLAFPLPPLDAPAFAPALEAVPRPVSRRPAKSEQAPAPSPPVRAARAGRVIKPTAKFVQRMRRESGEEEDEQAEDDKEEDEEEENEEEDRENRLNETRPRGRARRAVDKRRTRTTMKREGGEEEDDGDEEEADWEDEVAGNNNATDAGGDVPKRARRRSAAAPGQVNRAALLQWYLEKDGLNCSPTVEEKEELAAASGLTTKQVDYFLWNRRKRERERSRVEGAPVKSRASKKNGSATNGGGSGRRKKREKSARPRREEQAEQQGEDPPAPAFAVMANSPTSLSSVLPAPPFSPPPTPVPTPQIPPMVSPPPMPPLPSSSLPPPPPMPVNTAL